MKSVIQSKTSNKQRNASIDLLRIISMLMIVSHHFALSLVNESIINQTSNVLIIGGKIGVNIFILITGFTMIDLDFRH